MSVGGPPWELEPGGQRAGYAGERRLELARRDRYEVQGLADGAGEAPQDWSPGQKVTLAALALIAASLVWKGAVLGHYYFRQDDFSLMDYAARYGLRWQYIGRVWSGHFLAGGYVLGWLLVKIAPYNWTVSVAGELAAIAVASLAAWRLFRTLLGNRPAILIPLALYVLSPLTFESASWWISAVETIPLQIAIFTTLDAHIRYLRTGRIRHAVIATAWLAFGLVCSEKAAVIPFVLFTVTEGYLVRRRSLVVAIRDTAVGYWRSWAMYVAAVGCYAVVFFIRLGGSVNQPAIPPAHLVRTFAWSLAFHSFVPGLVGGPWTWSAGGSVSGNGFAVPPPELAWLALLAVGGVVVASVWTRRRAWRGWAILLGWFAVADILPVVIGRVSISAPGYAVTLGSGTRYVADISALLPIVVALIFWPVAVPLGADQDSGPRRELFSSAGWREAAIALVAVFAIGSVWTVTQYEKQSLVPAKSYIDNARSALAHAPTGTVIVDRPVPASVMQWPYYGPNSVTSIVLGPLSRSGAHVIWTSHPAGNVGGLKIFGSDGRLVPADITGVGARSKSFYADCVTVRRPRLDVLLPPAAAGFAPYIGVLRIDYAADAATGESVNIRYNGINGTIPIAGKTNSFYMTVRGAASEITLQATLTAGSSFCFEDAMAGYFIAPSASAPRG